MQDALECRELCEQGRDDEGQGDADAGTDDGEQEAFPSSRATVRRRVQPKALRSPNSRVRSKSESNMVLPTMMAPMRMASTVLPLTAAWRYTRFVSALPNWLAVRMVVSWGWS